MGRQADVGSRGRAVLRYVVPQTREALGGTVRPRLRDRQHGAEGPPGRQGRQPCRDDPARYAGPPGVHHHDRRVPRLPARPRHSVRALRGGRRAPLAARGEDGPSPRGRRGPAARVGPLRCQVLDARDDGDGPQHRARRHLGRGSGATDGQPAVRLGLLPATRADVRHHGAGPGRNRLRGRARGRQGRQGRRGRCRPRRRRPPRPRGDVPAPRRGRDGRPLPPGPPHPAARRRPGRLPVLELRPGDPLPASGTDPRRPRNRRQRPGHGVRQPRPGLRLGSRVHQGPGDRRHRRVRGLPARRSGRGRRRRHPQHPQPRGARAARPHELRPAAGDHGRPRAALPRHVRHRVHHRAGQALDAADAGGQAHR